MEVEAESDFLGEGVVPIWIRPSQDPRAECRVWVLDLGSTPDIIRLKLNSLKELQRTSGHFML